jgi:hypothetical protein
VMCGPKQERTGTSVRMSHTWSRPAVSVNPPQTPLPPPLYPPHSFPLDPSPSTIAFSPSHPRSFNGHARTQAHTGIPGAALEHTYRTTARCNKCPALHQAPRCNKCAATSAPHCNKGPALPQVPRPAPSAPPCTRCAALHSAPRRAGSPQGHPAGRRRQPAHSPAPPAMPGPAAPPPPAPRWSPGWCCPTPTR